MKMISMRTLLALGAMLSLPSLITANELGFANLEGQRPGAQPRNAPASGVRQVAHLSEISAGEEAMPGIYGDPFANESYPGMESYPRMYEQGGTGSCGCGSCGCGDSYCGKSYCGDYGDSGYQSNAGMYYAEVQSMFLRAHVSDQVVGKLSEKYEYSPRFILGYEAPSGLGARARYWTYGRTTEILDSTVDDIRFDFDVVDLEGTSRFCTSHADLVISGGFRWANVEITQDDDDDIDSSMPGITFAADLRSAICRGCRTEWAAVFGARWSLLGCDWEGDGNDFIQETRDDNVVAHEIYGGVEFLCHRCGYDLYARLIFEVQNWRSDALDTTSPVDSIGFVGPAVHAGLTF
jgi:hypothetical protein